MLDLKMIWPDEITILELRPWILGQLKEYGTPLRWAITEVQPNKDKTSASHIRVEAVLIVSN